MSDSVYRVTEVIGTSPTSWEEAAKNAVETAAKTLRDLRVGEVVRFDVSIEDGKVTRQIEDVAYQIRTPEFWNACAAICDERDYRLGGSFFDGKGQPGQVSAVSHGSSTTRFNGINVINTARSLG